MRSFGFDPADLHPLKKFAMEALAKPATLALSAATKERRFKAVFSNR